MRFAAGTLRFSAGYSTRSVVKMRGKKGENKKGGSRIFPRFSIIAYEIFLFSNNNTRAISQQFLKRQRAFSAALT
jgi:hypothetical protein